jgi:acetyl-CoA C-acetyltransferase
VPVQKRVYLHGSADCHEKILISERPTYSGSPAIGIGAAHALAEAGVRIADIAHIDLYACFPSAVEIAADEIGLSHSDPRGLTLTGGLPYFGGPGNAYSLHAIAEAATRCRAAPGSRAFVFANGGYLTRHSFGVWCSAPRPFTRANPQTYQRAINAFESPAFTETPEGPGRIETFTIVHDRGKPAFAILIGRLEADNRRFLARIQDIGQALPARLAIGGRVMVRSGDNGNLAAPE